MGMIDQADNFFNQLNYVAPSMLEMTPDSSVLMTGPSDFGATRAQANSVFDLDKINFSALTLPNVQKSSSKKKKKVKN